MPDLDSLTFVLLTSISVTGCYAVCFSPSFLCHSGNWDVHMYRSRLLILFLAQIFGRSTAIESKLTYLNINASTWLWNPNLPAKQEQQAHRRTGTMRLGGAAPCLPEKITQCPIA